MLYDLVQFVVNVTFWYLECNVYRVQICEYIYNCTYIINYANSRSYSVITNHDIYMLPANVLKIQIHSIWVDILAVSFYPRIVRIAYIVYYEYILFDQVHACIVYHDMVSFTAKLMSYLHVIAALYLLSSVSFSALKHGCSVYHYLRHRYDYSQTTDKTVGSIKDSWPPLKWNIYW